ncbi:type IV pilus assembly protein PilM [Dendrosporobacter sp. 1207_IL3150]|uniref:type IV pilus assembly protein PilM n=1 Tax=Dendrosporobacter sp. 1207_IL3150 TaxID=3084054 RepID=UPI002FDA2F9B
MQSKVLWDKIKNRILRKSDKVLGIDIGTGSLKIVELSFNNERFVVKNIAIGDFPENLFEDGKLVKVDEFTYILQQLVATSGFSSRDAVLALGGKSIFIREIAFPKMAEEEIREAIKWEMEKYVPYAPDSYHYDFSIVGEVENGMELKVLLVAAPKVNIDPIIAVVKNAGLKPVAIDGEAFALYRTLENAENSMIVDIGQFASQLIIYQNGIPTVTRMIPISGQRFTEAVMSALDLDETEAELLKKRQKNLLPQVNGINDNTEIHDQMMMIVDELAREIRRTVEFYQIQNKHSSIEKIIISGGGACLDNLGEQLKSILDLPIVLNSASGTIDYSPSFDPNYIKDVAPRLAVAIGLALRGGEV